MFKSALVIVSLFVCSNAYAQYDPSMDQYLRFKAFEATQRPTQYYSSPMENRGDYYARQNTLDTQRQTERANYYYCMRHPDRC